MSGGLVGDSENHPGEESTRFLREKLNIPQAFTWGRNMGEGLTMPSLSNIV